VDVAFIGSCTNGRLSDLRAAASVFAGRHVADGVRALVVPGSQQVKKQAEAEGLDRVFREAGAEWREPGCSMCIAMNGDRPRARALRGEHEQPQLRGPAGPGRAHAPGQPPHRRRRRRHRPRHRRARADEVEMDPFRVLTGRTVVLPMDDVDTDQIIPARFLKGTTRTGLGKGLFADRRYAADGSPRPEFPLNRPEAAGAARPGDGQELRLRLVPRARGVGARGPGLPRRHRPELRRHLPRQRAEERLPAHRGSGAVHAQLARRAARP
jgi:hypothetical protein